MTSYALCAKIYFRDYFYSDWEVRMKKFKSVLLHPHTYVLLYLIAYTLFSVLSLTDFPWIHSDESWLAGLTRNMAELSDFSATEPFFDARPRYPHAIKILFHALQMLFLSIGGYSVATVRLLSLLAGVLSLFFFYLTAKKLLNHPFTAFILMVLFSADIQFIYASHIARQESLLLLSLTLCLYLFFRNSTPNTVRSAIALGVVTGLSVGLHPNSFLIACMIGCAYLAWLITHPSDSKKPLFTYISTTGIFAAVFVLLSYTFDPQFLTHYISNGISEFDIDAAPGSRLSALFSFFKRLFLREGGTYYVADIRLQLLLFLFAALLLLAFYFMMRKEEETKDTCRKLLVLLCSGFGLITGIFLIGRFSQLSILFLFPIGWLLTAFALNLFDSTIKKGLYALLLFAVCFISFRSITPFLSGESYADYLTKVSAFVAPDDRVIANLNMDFYFENEALHDYRNLPYVMQSAGNLDVYIEENRIEYIFYSAELTYYYEHRPYYNAIYGNIMFAEALLDYCETNCDYIGSFQSARYAPRILELIGQEAYAEVKVYKTKYAEEP